MADITVTLPNGSSILFPEGTSPEKIREVARKASGMAAAPQRSGAEEMRARGLQSPNPDQSGANATAENALMDAASEGFVQSAPAFSRMASTAAGLPFVGEWTDEGVGAVMGQGAGDQVRAAQDAFSRARPKEDTALRMAGGVVGSLSALAAAPAVAAAAPNALAMRVGAGALAGAAAGGLEGAVSGAGANEGNRLSGARSGAAMGAGFGAAAGAAAPMVSAGLSKLVQHIKGSDIAGIAQTLGISAPAARAVKAALEGDDLQRAGQNLQRGGPDAILAEAGPSTQALANATAASGGRATTIMRDAIDTRMQGGATAVRGAMDDAFKPGTSVIPAPPKLGTLYDAAYAKPIDYSKEAGRSIESLVPRVPKEEWAKARKLIEMDPDVPEEIKRQFLVSISEDGTRTKGTLPSVLELDYVTRSLNDTAKAGDGKGALGGNTNQGRLYGNLSRRIRDAVKESVPEYRRALDFASTEIGIKEAREFGSTILRDNVTRAQVLEQIKGAPQAERLAAKAAVREALDDTLANTKRIMSRAGSDTEVGEAIKAVKNLSSRASRGKLTILLGKDEATRLTDAMDEAATAFEIGAALSRNSDTAVRTAVQQSVRASAAPNVVQRLLAGEPLQAGKRLAQIFTGNSPEAVAAREAGVFEQIATALTQIKGPEAQRALSGVQRAMAGQRITDAQARNIGHLTATALAAGGYQSGMQATQSRLPR